MLQLSDCSRVTPMLLRTNRRPRHVDDELACGVIARTGSPTIVQIQVLVPKRNKQPGPPDDDATYGEWSKQVRRWSDDKQAFVFEAHVIPALAIAVGERGGWKARVKMELDGHSIWISRVKWLRSDLLS